MYFWKPKGLLSCVMDEKHLRINIYGFILSINSPIWGFLVMNFSNLARKYCTMIEPTTNSLNANTKTRISNYATTKVVHMWETAKTLYWCKLCLARFSRSLMPCLQKKAKGLLRRKIWLSYEQKNGQLWSGYNSLHFSIHIALIKLKVWLNPFVIHPITHW